MTAVRMMLPVQEHAHSQPCPACQGRGVNGARYEMQAGAEVVLLLEVFCPACGGCGNGHPEHAGCKAAWHPDPDDDYLDGLEGEDEDEDEDAGPSCYSCGSGRGWYPIQGFTGEGDATEMYTLRGLCGCATGRLVPEGGMAPAAAGHTGTVRDEITDEPSGYEDQAAAFISGVERYAALGLPELPGDPAAAAAMRAAGYEVLAEVREVDGPVAMVSVSGGDEDDRYPVRAADVTWAVGATAEQLAGVEFIATMTETPETGPVLSAFRPVPVPDAAAAGTEMTVRCLIVFGDQAELVADGAEEEGDVARWPAAAIADQTGLQLKELPGKRFRARVTQEDGRVLFSGFSLLP